MRRGLKLRNYQLPKLQNRRRGYVLITLMLFIALLTIAALAVLPEVAFQIKRDREEEMIHRALGYSRGIRRYYKKFGRYPVRIEELENTNNLRFIRKRYQDPITGKDFKLLHLGDVHLNFGPVLGGQNPQPQFGAPGVPNPAQVAASQQAVVSQQVGGANPAVPGAVDASDAGDKNSDQGTGNGPTTFGGGPILGVASASKAKTIREFNNKNHYNDWLFIYDPTSDRGGMLNAPLQPDLNKGFGNQGQPGAAPGPGGVAPNAGPQPPQGPPNPNPGPPEQ